MYLMGKIYDGLKAIPAEAVGSAAIIAIATFMATRPSELEKKVVEQKVVAPHKGGGSYAKPALCPPIINYSDFHQPTPYSNFGGFDNGDFGPFDAEVKNSILLNEKIKASVLQPSQKQ